jgi:hypothetical protein
VSHRKDALQCTSPALRQTNLTRATVSISQNEPDVSLVLLRPITPATAFGRARLIKMPTLRRDAHAEHTFVCRSRTNLTPIAS